MTEFENSQVFVAKRGTSAHWVAGDPSVYPYEYGQHSPHNWSDGFRVYIHKSGFTDMQTSEQMQQFAKTRDWQVDWIVVGKKDRMQNKEETVFRIKTMSKVRLATLCAYCGTGLCRC